MNSKTQLTNEELGVRELLQLQAPQAKMLIETGFLADLALEEGSLWDSLEDYGAEEDEIQYSSRMKSRSKSPDDATNFVFVPYILETYLTFGVLACLDQFLFTIIILPLRTIYALIQVYKGKTLIPAQKIDIARFLLMMTVFTILRILIHDMDELQTYASAESLLKIKILLKYVCPTLDNVIKDFTGTTLASFWYFISDSQKESSSSSSSSYYRSLVFYSCMSVTCLTLHSFILLFHVAVLDAAIRDGINRTHSSDDSYSVFRG